VSASAKLSGWPTNPSYKFGGTLDQVMVYNRALTDPEILALYQTHAPGAPSVFVQPNALGLPVTTRGAYEGAYLYAAATYDSHGLLLSVSDVGRAPTGGPNVTSFVYSTLLGSLQPYATMVQRPDGKRLYYAYDFQSGVQYGLLDVDCRRARVQYDALSRPFQTESYDTDSNEILHVDMDTRTSQFKDVSCNGNSDSTMGNGLTLYGTRAASTVPATRF
jgi:hypothetical protein